VRYYFAAAYGRHAEMTRNADVLEAAIDAHVMSTWHREVTPGLDESFDAAYLAAHPREAWEHGKRDLEDLACADAIVSFTDGVPARGGRHVEHGVAIGYRVWDPDYTDTGPARLIVVGPREHVFHCHPATEVYAGFAVFLQHEIADHIARTAH
jgi:hypothetical protein